MKKDNRITREIGGWLLIILQMAVGAVVMKTGFDLGAGNLNPSVSMSTDPITPLFIILLGAYFCFSGVLRKLLGKR